MAKFMSSGLIQIGSSILFHCPVFLIIKVCITAILWEEGMCQSTTGPIKRVTVAMSLFLKSNVNVSSTRIFLLKLQGCYVWPQLKGSFNLLVDLFFSPSTRRRVPVKTIRYLLLPGSFHLSFSFFVSFGDEVTKISCHFQAKTVQLIFLFFVKTKIERWFEPGINFDLL